MNNDPCSYGGKSALSGSFDRGAGADWLRRGILWLFVLLLLRLLSLATYPLTDRTEARYAELAREMVVSGDWIMPQLDPGVPFWAKPPLATWAGALGISLGGVNAWAVRAPAWLAMVLGLWSVYAAGRRLWGEREARVAAMVLVCSPLFLLLAGGVMTDPYFGLGIMLILSGWMGMLAGWRAGRVRLGWWWWAWILGLAVASLAKSPLLAWILGVGPAVVLGVRPDGRAFLRQVPWGRGLAVYVGLTGPWFWLAEHHDPGFLRYYFWGEHFQRYLVPNWSGDRYGNPDPQTLGTVWLFLGMALVPILPLWLWLRRGDFWRIRPGRVFSWLREAPLEQVFLVFFALASPCFFTPAGSVLITYVFPAVPAASLLMGHWFARRDPRSASFWVGRSVVAMCGVLVLGIGLVTVFPQMFYSKSHAELMGFAPDPATVRYACGKPYSAEFYGADAPVKLTGRDDPGWRRLPKDVLIITERDDLSRVPHDLRGSLVLRHRVGRYQMWSLTPRGPNPDGLSKVEGMGDMAGAVTVR